MSTQEILASPMEGFDGRAGWEFREAHLGYAMQPSGGASTPAVTIDPDLAPSGADQRFLEWLFHAGVSGCVFAVAIAGASSSGGSSSVPLRMSTYAAAPFYAVPRRSDGRHESATSELSAELLLNRSEESDVHREATSAGSGLAASIALTAADQVEVVQEVLGLPLTTLAQIIGVARGTLYGWLRGDVDVPRDTRRARRLADLSRLAQMWQDKLPSSVGRLVFSPVSAAGESLADLFEAEEWNAHAIESAMQVVADRLTVRDADRQKALRELDGRAKNVRMTDIELERIRVRGVV